MHWAKMQEEDQERPSNEQRAERVSCGELTKKAKDRKLWQLISSDNGLYAPIRAQSGFSECAHALNQALVVRRLDNAIHRIKCYPVDKCQKTNHYLLDTDLSSG